MKKIVQALLSAGLLFSVLPQPVYATEADPASYVGHYSANQSFAFVNSRYYDGTNQVKVFNFGWAANSSSGEYYLNGDWPDMEHVYTREDYHSTTTPTNEIGADGDGQLSSANAGTYTTVNISNFTLYGPDALNYRLPTTLNNVPTYIEIWQVAPELTLTSDVQGTIQRNQSFTLTLTIQNDFNNVSGLPTTDQVSFDVENAEATSAITQTGNTYVQTFKATNDIHAQAIEAKAGVKNNATNYKESYQTLSLALPAIHSISYQFVSGTQGKDLPDSITKLLPQTTTAQEGQTVTPTQPETNQVKESDGVWTFAGYDANQKSVDADITFIGAWTFTANAPTHTNKNQPSNTNAKPKPVQKNKGTQTGITTHSTQWMRLFGGSLVVCLLMVVLRKRKISN
ncbi:MAG: SHIRT domain-containing protein [Absicoccus porci]|uniref:SHIRT domain-containing protein n=1 Tax=Absicoccus porci TaxID=2486576 RepID=UPI002409966D|nr:SHIRT domain-containing protein [Absicoccus porci]MDD6459425.1 SHIRT domain-containing protein [Absicoccus porci]